eukprot:4616280-Prymnesium_polylepis.1
MIARIRLMQRPSIASESFCPATSSSAVIASERQAGRWRTRCTGRPCATCRKRTSSVNSKVGANCCSGSRHPSTSIRRASHACGLGWQWQCCAARRQR